MAKGKAAAKKGNKVPDVVMVPMKEVAPNWWNPNSQKAERFNALFESMQEYGFLEAIQVTPLCEELLDAFDQDEDREHVRTLMSEGKKWLVLQGSHRFQAAEVAGEQDFPEIPAVVLEPKDVDRLKALSVRMNLIKGEIDPERFTKMWQEMAEKGYSEQFSMDMFGVTSRKELDGLIKQMRSDLDPELKKEFDAHREEIKTIEDLGRVLNELFSRYGDELAFGYMTFTWGGKTHTWVRLSKQTAALLSEVKGFCREQRVDINNPLGAAFKVVLGQEMPWPEAKAEDLSIAE